MRESERVPSHSFSENALGLQSMIRWLIPRENQFYTFLEQQADTIHEGALAMAEFKSPLQMAEDVRRAVQEAEHKGDAIVHEVEEALARTFVTPLDREDLQKLSSELDDVIDYTNGAARAAVLMGVDQPTEPMVNLIDKLVESTGVIKAAIPNLRRHDYREVMTASRTLRRLEKEGDAIYRGAVYELFHDPQIEVKVLLREKEVLEGLERAIDSCEHVASTLANLAIKHG